MHLPQCCFTRVSFSTVLCITTLCAGQINAHSAEPSDDPQGITAHLNGALHAMHEQCRVIEMGGVVSIQFISEYPVDFNVHHHGENETQFPVRLSDVNTYQGEFIAEPDHAYCFMWENKTARTQAWTIDMRIDVLPVESVSR